MHSLGRIGEDKALEYLVSKGYGIIARNYREKYGEIDIISRAPNKTLVFVEVKTLTSPKNFDSQYFLNPEDHLTFSKLSKLKRICQHYANSKKIEYSEDKNWQIDLIAIQIRGGEFYINHYENIT